MKRTFTHGPAGLKAVVIEVDGPRVAVLQRKADGSVKRSEKVLKGEAEALAESERLVRDLLAHGYAEKGASAPSRSKPAPKAIQTVLEEEGASAEAAGPVIPRLAPAAKADGETPKKKGGKKKRKKKAKNPDALDRRVLGAVAAVGVLVMGFLGYFAYDVFLKPATIVGTWKGSMIEFETGKAMVHTEYELVLDEKKNAALVLQEKFRSVGTYSLKGDRLKLMLKSDTEDGEGGGEGDGPSEREYKVALGRVTLDLYDPESGKQLVQLIRFREPPVVGKGKEAPAIAAPANVNTEVDKAADERLASVEFAPKDGAFKVRHPKGWEPDTGSRPDNTYSWASFTRGSAKIQVHADITGSLMSGAANPGDYEEGSELAPVHSAHTMNQKNVAEEFSDFQESKPSTFKGSGLGEGRIGTFTASGGFFGGRLRGYRVTLLTNDRRVSVVCQCPEKEFPDLKPTFLAVCRSLSR